MHSILNNYRVILESIKDGVFTVNLDWKIMTFNRAAEEITGFDRKDAIGRKCCEIFRTTICQAGCILKDTIHSNYSTADIPVFITRADNRRIPVSVNTAVLKDSQGKVFGGVEIFRDLTEINRLRKVCMKEHSFDDIVSKNSVMCRYFSILPQISESKSTVLIQGPTGTGKELMARAIHNHSQFKGGPFVAVNCGAMPETLVESELFGYKQGAFTDAKKDKPGRFAMAQDGTIFLDEIGDIPLAAQVRLLRVLQEKCYEPLGSNTSEETNARVIAASHHDLDELVKTGRFREDLYYRINVMRILLPPLMERKEDLPLLVDHFIERFNLSLGKEILGISPEAMAVLMLYDFPGNIRELENTMEHAFVLCNEGLIYPHHLPDRFQNHTVALPASTGMTLVESEKYLITQALSKNNWKKMATARQLGID
ncbi:MAG: sigma 54-interacting transcriptional regulator, partial [Proteobacteria bacterium]|nr:sigma 54-interacting transcriptional regulator [Pseudomonadota bacterium]